MHSNERWNTYWESATRAIAQGKLEHAEPLLYATLDVAEDFDANDPRLLMTLECLAEVLFKTDRVQQAEPIVKRIIAVFEQRYRTGHPDIGVFTNNLGLIYHKQGKFFMAETEYQRALGMQAKLLGHAHPQTINVMGNYARLLRETHRDREAQHLESCIKGAQTGTWKQSGIFAAYAGSPDQEAPSAPFKQPTYGRATEKTVHDLPAARLNPDNLPTIPQGFKKSQQQGNAVQRMMQKGQKHAQ